MPVAAAALPPSEKPLADEAPRDSVGRWGMLVIAVLQTAACAATLILVVDFRMGSALAVACLVGFVAYGEEKSVVLLGYWSVLSLILCLLSVMELWRLDREGPFRPQPGVLVPAALQKYIHNSLRWTIAAFTAVINLSGVLLGIHRCVQLTMPFSPGEQLRRRRRSKLSRGGEEQRCGKGPPGGFAQGSVAGYGGCDVSCRSGGGLEPKSFAAAHRIV